jgi:hypothetical protein
LEPIRWMVGPVETFTLGLCAITTSGAVLDPHSRTRAASAGAGSETATASGSEREGCSGPTMRKPIMASKLAPCRGGSPHSGQATRSAAAAGPNRARPPGQHAWIMREPSLLRLPPAFLLLCLKTSPRKREEREAR